MSDVTLVVTSCDRHDLLERTLRSFGKFNDYPLEETIVVEDTANLAAPAWFAELAVAHPNFGPMTWITNEKREGQIFAIDRAYALVKTPYIFHCEDDWEFFRGDFIGPSKCLLESYPKIFTVSLYATSCYGHPLAHDSLFPVPIQQPYWCEGWGGFNFNPGLRRMADYQEICGGAYGNVCGYKMTGLTHELKLSRKHLDLGFRVSTLVGGLDQQRPYVTHIGAGRSRAGRAA